MVGKEGQPPSFFDVRGQIVYVRVLPTSHPPLRGWVGDESSGHEAPKPIEPIGEADSRDSLADERVIDMSQIPDSEFGTRVDRLLKGRAVDLPDVIRARLGDSPSEEMAPPYY